MQLLNYTLHPKIVKKNINLTLLTLNSVRINYLIFVNYNSSKHFEYNTLNFN